MDIYPTYQTLLGNGTLFWKGLGVNLMAPEQNRILNHENALLLSDKVIRNNYFQR
jgi:hypothetical protein